MSQYGDGEPVPVHETVVRTARKPHKCSACDEQIEPRQRYTRVALLFEGQWQVTNRCARCQKIYEHLSDRIAKGGDSEEYCDGELNCGHEYEERWREPPPENIAALAFWRPGDPLP
jgi:hypothetical protein